MKNKDLISLKKNMGLSRNLNSEIEIVSLTDDLARKIKGGTGAPVKGRNVGCVNVVCW